MIDLGLHRISRLLLRTPLPWRAIHVAGTNGKGSICAYVSEMLDVYNRSSWKDFNRGSELRHGRFTSPHLIDRWDCITIAGEPITHSAFTEAEKAILERNRRQSFAATEFEILTATAFEIFTQEKLDVGVVEVGMGGRLDATNIIGQAQDVPEDLRDRNYRPAPLVTTISSIGLDHQAFLGSTLEEVAREKAGIIKSHVPVVYDDTNDGRVLRVIRSVAAESNSSLISASLAKAQSAKLQPESLVADILQKHESNGTLQSTVRNNIALAFLSTWIALQQLGRVGLETKVQTPGGSRDQAHLAEEMIKAATRTSFPGRQQSISIENLTGRKENILLDGAHNAQSAVSLASKVEELRVSQRKDGGKASVTWVLAASSSKDVNEILSPLLKHGDSAYAVQFGPVDGMPWVMPLASDRLMNAAKAVVDDPQTLNTYDYGADILGALTAASKEAAGRPLVVAGSLYLVGDILRLLRDSQ